MRNLYFILLCLVCMASTSVYAQTLIVQQAGTRQALEGVTITSASANAVTDAAGKADISTMKSDTGEIQIRSVGFETLRTRYALLEKQGFMAIMQEDRISLDAVVVSATRWQQSRRETPLRISTIGAKEVMLQNPQTAADLLSLSGEVFIQKSQLGGGSPMIRGFATNRVLLTVDGVRMNNAIFRSGNLQNVISLDPFSIQRTEVVYGPGSVIYGSDAIGGVMHFSTLEPAFSSVNANAAVRYASANNEKTGHADFSVGGKKLAFAGSATFSDYDNLLMGKNGPDDYLRPRYVIRINGRDSVVANSNPRLQVPSAYNQFNWMHKLRWAPGEKWELQYGFHYSATSDYSRYDRLLRPRGNTLRSAEWDYGPQIWMMNNLSAAHHSESKWFDNVSFRVAHQFFEESRIERNLNSLTRMIRTEKVHALSANVDFEKTRQNGQRFFYGLEAVYNKVGSTGEDVNIETELRRAAPSRYPDGALWYSAAAYLTWKAPLSEQLTLQTGARYNIAGLQAEFDTTLFVLPFAEARQASGALTGSVGVIWSPTALWLFSANAASGFRTPNVDDVGKVFDSSPGFVVVPNADIRPEYAYNFDLGIARTFGSTLKVDVTGFYTLLDNALVRRNFTLNGQDSVLYGGEMSRVQAIQNAAVAKVWGLQLGLELKLPAGFGLRVHHNFQKGEEELDNGSVAPLRHAAPSFGTTRLTWSNRKWQAELNLIYNAEVANADLAPEEQGKEYLYAQDAAGNPYTPAWHTINLKTSYQLGNRANIGFGIENITDQRYRPYSSGITAPGRNFVVSLRVKAR
ncbi:MAG TPA: TonB-dependent receptor [Saprospiraceae bacterium]|nr:TonB-dependent receptor [Saprospiraceae bacterium]